MQESLRQEQAAFLEASDRASQLKSELAEAQGELQDEQESAAALGEEVVSLTAQLESSQKDYDLAATRAAGLQKGARLELRVPHCECS